MAEEITNEDIVNAALGPKITKTEEGMVEEHSLKDLLAAQAAINNVSPEAVPWGIRMARVRPGSTTPGSRF